MTPAETNEVTQNVTCCITCEILKEIDEVMSDSQQNVTMERKTIEQNN
jgi:hypothetical protein